MSETVVTAKWVGSGLRYIGTDSKGNIVRMGGDDLSPPQMVLLGLAGCMGMDTVYVLEKKRLKIEAIDVTIIGHQPETYPKPFTNIEIHFTITGQDLPENAIAKAIELSRDKYCIVGQTLINPVKLDTSFTINEQENATA